MTDETIDTKPTPGVEPAAKVETPKPTTEPGEPKGVTFSAEQQTYLNKLIADTKREAKEAVKKQFADYTDLKAAKAKLDEIEKEKLSDEEKKKAELAKLQMQIDTKEKELSDRNLRDLKRLKIEQAIADGKMDMPKGKTLDSLVKRCLGTTEEEIDADVEEIIGFFPHVEPAPAPKPAANGSGHPPVSDKGTKTFTRAQIKDRDFYEANREEIQKALVEGRIK